MKYPSLLICMIFLLKKTFLANLFCPITIPPWTNFPLNIVSLENVVDAENKIITKKINFL